MKGEWTGYAENEVTMTTLNLLSWDHQIGITKEIQLNWIFSEYFSMRVKISMNE